MNAEEIRADQTGSNEPIGRPFQSFDCFWGDHANCTNDHRWPCACQCHRKDPGMKPIPDLTLAEAHQALRQFKLMVRNFAPRLRVDAADIDNFIRASGQAQCPKCGLEYFDHPHVDGLVVSCDGRLLKL